MSAVITLIKQYLLAKIPIHKTKMGARVGDLILYTTCLIFVLVGGGGVCVNCKKQKRTFEPIRDTRDYRRVEKRMMRTKTKTPRLPPKSQTTTSIGSGAAATTSTTTTEVVSCGTVFGAVGTVCRSWSFRTKTRTQRDSRHRRKPNRARGWLRTAGSYWWRRWTAAFGFVHRYRLPFRRSFFYT